MHPTAQPETLLYIKELTASHGANADYSSISSLSYSPDGRYVYYGDGMNLIVYDLQEKAYKILKDMFSVRILSFSPNGKYAVLDISSGDPGDGGRTIISLDGTILRDLGGYGVAWSPDGSKLAVSRWDVHTDVWLTPPWSNRTIYLETITGGHVEETVLVKANTQESNEPLRWINNNMLLFEKTVFAEPLIIKNAKDLDEKSYYKELERLGKLLNSGKDSTWQIDIDTLKATPR